MRLLCTSVKITSLLIIIDDGAITSGASSPRRQRVTALIKDYLSYVLDQTAGADGCRLFIQSNRGLNSRNIEARPLGMLRILDQIELCF